MRLTRIWVAGAVLAGVALFAASDNAWAQAAWQEAPMVDDNGDASVDWQQRVLRSPQQRLRWQSPGHAPASANVYQTAQRPSYDRKVFDTASMSREPAIAGRQRFDVASTQEVVPPGEMQYEPMAPDGVFADQAGCASCGGLGDCDSCGVPCGEYCDFGYECFDGRCNWWLRNLTFFAGAQGFKGPMDRGVNGNFGFHEGLGIAGPLGDPWGCGYQIGANFVHSNFSPAQTVILPDQTVFRGASRNQCFVTAGIFRRVLCRGFQWGIAYDYLHDRYYEDYDVQQLRSEIGFVFDDLHEIGFYGAYGVGTDRITTAKVDPTDMFVMYVRRNFEGGGQGRLWGGATSYGDGLLGAQLWVPLGKGFALDNRINYLIPNVTSDQRSPDYRGTAQQCESWGLTIQLVWYPGQSALCQPQNPYRPLFDVADNALFMVNRLPNQ